VALAKVDVLSAGQSLAAAGIAPTADFPAADRRCSRFAGRQEPQRRGQASGALHKIVEEDPSLSFEARGETHELLIKGQGEMHLKVAVDKLAGRYNVAVETTTPRVAYRETDPGRHPAARRYKRQTGGHGQFADIKVEIKPLPRGSGFRFVDKIVGGVVPRNFIPASRRACSIHQGRPARPTGGRPRGHAVRRPVPRRRQLGNVVQDGARIAMSEAMPKCKPVLLEPILNVTVAGPSDRPRASSRLISGRRGPAPGLRRAAGLDRLGRGLGPDAEAEVADMIVEIRSVTQGVGTYRTEFDHLQELVGRTADRIVEETKKRAA
jgi:Translation elongation factors (GTPases)